MSKIERTPLGNSYWNEDGIYQKEYSDLYERLVPNQGSAETLHGELIRSVSRLQWDYFNNGNCNAAEITYDEDEETCQDCNGTGLIEGQEECESCDGTGVSNYEDVDEVKISEFYLQFIRLIKESLQTNLETSIIDQVMASVESIIKSSSDNREYFNNDNVDKYNHMMDLVVWFCLNTEDTKLPEWYVKD